MIPYTSSHNFTYDFAQEWLSAWNRHDIEAILRHVQEDCIHVSPIALQLTGCELVRGKAALRPYFTRLLQRAQRVNFVYQSASWDRMNRNLAIFYDAEADDFAIRCCERMVLDRDGLQVESYAHQGAIYPVRRATVEATVLEKRAELGRGDFHSDRGLRLVGDASTPPKLN